MPERSIRMAGGNRDALPERFDFSTARARPAGPCMSRHRCGPTSRASLLVVVDSAPNSEGRWERVAIGLGANLESRESNLLSAALHLGEELLSPLLSPLVASRPVGCPPGSPEFLNAVLVGLCRRTPDDLLAVLKALEHRTGRRAASRNAPRVLDCDLLVYGRIELDRDELRLPHPRLAERSFWTAPLAVVAPDLPVPRLGAAAELAGNAGAPAWRPWATGSVEALHRAGVSVPSSPFADC